MNISAVSKAANLPSKTIRYYEDIGLIKPLRDANGYRAFSENDVHKLTFLGRARALGFTIADCRDLLALWEDQGRASSDVRRISREHLVRMEDKIASLQAMHATLSDLVEACQGDNRPDCPILKGLSADG